jgi:hypothetical protein
VFVEPGHKALEIFVKSVVIAIMIPGPIGSAIVAFLLFTLPAYVEDDCPTIANKDGRNCQNPMIIDLQVLLQRLLGVIKTLLRTLISAEQNKLKGRLALFFGLINL